MDQVWPGGLALAPLSKLEKHTLAMHLQTSLIQVAPVQDQVWLGRQALAPLSYFEKRHT